jgi:DNA-binding MarR family transcriptional regulator
MPDRPTRHQVRVTAADYAALASFRHALRRFLHFSAEAAREAGLSPQQHQLLLALKGFPTGTSVSITDLADQLMLKHHSVVGLLDRLAQRGLVRREAADDDRRFVHIVLTARGEALIQRLSATHKQELAMVGPQLRRLLEKIAADE